MTCLFVGMVLAKCKINSSDYFSFESSISALTAKDKHSQIKWCIAVKRLPQKSIKKETLYSRWDI